jgi:hypothetical protein
MPLASLVFPQDPRYDKVLVFSYTLLILKVAAAGPL